MSTNKTKQNPADQEFKGPVRRNKKKNSWYRNPPFHNNKVNKPQHQQKK